MSVTVGNGGSAQACMLHGPAVPLVQYCRDHWRSNAMQTWERGLSCLSQVAALLALIVKCVLLVCVLFLLVVVDVLVCVGCLVLLLSTLLL